MKNVINVEVTVDKEKWQSALDASFEKRKKEVKVDGFRKGAVTKEIYVKKFGIESLFADAADIALSGAYNDVLRDKKIIPVVEPKIDVKKIDKDGVTFAFTFITKPEVKLGEYKKLKAKKEKVVVSKEEIDEEVKNLQTRLAEIAIKESGTVEEGNTAVIDFEGVVDGKKLDGGSGENYPLEIGSHTFIPGFEEAVVGMKVGEKKDINLTFPENYTEELKNKPVTFTVTVREIKERILPELGEDFYKDLGFENIKTEEEFRSEVEKTIHDRKDASAEDAYINDCLEEASNNMKIEINPEIISEEVHRMMHQFEEQLKMQGLNMEQYMQFTGMSHDDFHKQMEPEATKRVKYRYLLEEIAQVEKIEVTDEEAKEDATNMAARYGVEVEELISMIGGMDAIKYDVRMRKAMEVLKGNK